MLTVLLGVFSKVNPLWIVLAFVVVVAVAVLAKRVPRGRRGAGAGDEAPWPFRVRRLITDPELVLFERLRAALPDQLVFPQVGATRVLEVAPGVEELPWRNRIAQLSIDFVVCAPDSTPIVAIELDDSSHERARNRDRDAKKDRACRDAGLRLVRWHVRAMPDVAAIRRAVLPDEHVEPSPVGVDC